MSTERGVTLIELIIAMLIIMVASLGFLTWEVNVFRNNAAAERNNVAHAMALDVADRLQRMSDQALIRHNANSKCVGYDNSSDLKACMFGGVMNCVSGSPSGSIAVGATGMTIFTNPWNGQIRMYDLNACEGKSWVDAGCGTAMVITPAANLNIDHPNAVGAAYNSVNPVRSIRNTTYYAVWSIAYLPCNAGTGTQRRKIFVTVYWISPEPKETILADLLFKLSSGKYSIKSVSLAVDKSIGVE